jgi:DnaD/phage-associated family protein
MAKDAYYFSHDSNAVIDPKILSMRADYGLEGYGLYWVIIEMLRCELDYQLPLNKNTYRAIKTLSNTSLNVEKFISDCIDDYDLLKADDNEENFYSSSLLRRMETWEDTKQIKKDKAKRAAQTRWNNAQAPKNESETIKEDAQAMHGQCSSNAQAMQNSEKGMLNDAQEKKRKEKKREENNEKEIKQEEKESKVVVVVDKSRNIFQEYEKAGFGLASTIQAEMLMDLEKTYGFEWTVDALKESAKSNIMKINYVEGILKNWKANGRDAPRPRYGKNKEPVKPDFTEREYDYSDLEKKLLGRE